MQEINVDMNIGILGLFGTWQEQLNRKDSKLKRWVEKKL